jgi:hypothetical protein
MYLCAIKQHFLGIATNFVCSETFHFCFNSESKGFKFLSSADKIFNLLVEIFYEPRKKRKQFYSYVEPNFIFFVGEQLGIALIKQTCCIL